MVKSTDEALVKKYKITKFPTFILLKNNEKPNAYTGSSYTYSELFEFINIYSETFVFVGDQE
jgi:thiol-disulfide isomerase/thioredoxin